MVFRWHLIYNRKKWLYNFLPKENNYKSWWNWRPCYRGRLGEGREWSQLMLTQYINEVGRTPKIKLKGDRGHRGVNWNRDEVARRQNFRGYKLSVPMRSLNVFTLILLLNITNTHLILWTNQFSRVLDSLVPTGVVSSTEIHC